MAAVVNKTIIINNDKESGFTCCSNKHDAGHLYV